MTLVALGLVGGACEDREPSGDAVGGLVVLSGDVGDTRITILGGDSSRQVPVPDPATAWISGTAGGGLVATLADGRLAVLDDAATTGADWRSVDPSNAGEAVGSLLFGVASPDGSRVASLALGAAGQFGVALTDPATDHLFFIKSARGSDAPFPMEINGAVDPDTIVLRIGRAYRFRFVGLSVTSPNATVYLTARPDSSLQNLRDTMLVNWRPLAKDGADLPERERTLRAARQLVSIGETHDFEFRPLERGQLRIEVRPPSAGRLFVRVPVRVE